MKKITMVEKVEYFCDLCEKNITDEQKYTCGVCDRIICSVHSESIKGWKDLWLVVCPICRPMYKKVKEQMNIDYKKHDNKHKEYCSKLYEEWKKESLTIDNKLNRG